MVGAKKKDWADEQKGIKMGFYSETERSGSRDLEGAEIWFGINYWNEAEEGLISEVNSALGISSPSGISGDPPNYTQGFGVAAQESLASNGIKTEAEAQAAMGVLPNDIDLWHKFTVGASNGKDWGFQLDTEQDSFILSWVVGIVLPGVPFADTAASDDITNVIASGDPSNDILFRWTVDEKGTPITSTTFVTEPDIYKNPDFGTNPFEVVVIPEPSSSVLVMLGALALIMRRKRS